MIWKRFRKNRMALWSLRVLYILVFVAVFGDFIANDKPLVCEIDGEMHFPILKQYAVNLGFSDSESRFFGVDWLELDYEYTVFPFIPYSPTGIDRKNMNFVSPFDEQNIKSNRYRHWLGTDQLGRDVASGMIRGVRIAMLVGIISMTIAFLIGIFLGVIAGYFGDTDFKISRIRLIFNILGVVLGIFYGFVVRGFVLSEASASGRLFIETVKSIGVFFIIVFILNLIASLFKKVKIPDKKITVPLDFLIMRFIEVFKSIPGLLLLLSIVAILQRPSIISVMVIIGLLRWTGIARYVRSEFLKIRELDYMTAGKVLGFSDLRIILRHALPNALTPVLITVAFGISSSILLEATLSFLGIGVAAEDVTWGSLLALARSNFSAWWLAVFPGVAIFITVTIFNLIAEGLQEAVNIRMKSDF